MIQHKQLDNVYRTFYDSVYNVDVSNDLYRVPFFSMVNGNKILFVGQNPGAPFTSEHHEHFDNFMSMNYDEQQECFKQSWHKSKFIAFLKLTCKQANVSFDDVSVTNLVKTWTKANKQPAVTEYDKKLLACEFKLIKPTHIIFVSKFAFNEFNNYLSLNDFIVIVVDHPATRLYSKNYAQELSTIIKARIREE